MIDKMAFGVGLGRFAIANRQVLDDGTLAVYYEALADQLTAVQWDDFTRWAVREELFEWIPKLEELRAAFLTWQRDQRKRLPGPEDTPESQDERQKRIQAQVAAKTDEQREAARRGMEILRAELQKRGVDVDGIFKPMPGGKP